MSDYATAQELREKFGRPVTPKTLAEWLGLDERTVRKYSARWGGVYVAPGRLLFFENLIGVYLYAHTRQGQEGQVEVPGGSGDSGDPEDETLSGHQSEELQSGSQVGGQNESVTQGVSGKRRKDPHGLLDPS